MSTIRSSADQSDPTERTLARVCRVCREAGAVRCNTKLRDLNIRVSVQDEGAIEIVASGVPFHHGAQLAADITLRSATTAAGLPCTTQRTLMGQCSTVQEWRKP